MDLKSHIPKPKRKMIKMVIQFVTAMFIITTLFAINSFMAYADNYSISEGVNKVAGAVYNGTSNSTHGGTSAIVNGVSYTRTGYLCYLLTKDGGTTGLPAYAFASPGYNGIAGSRWVCTSRRGQSVSSWKEPAPWQCTPWQEGGAPSNEPKIRDWFLQTGAGGKLNAQVFVLQYWGEAAVKNFESDEYILVIETIMNFQYSIAGGSGSNTPLVISPSEAKAITAAAREEAEKYMDNVPQAVLSGIAMTAQKSVKEIRDDWINQITEKAVEKIVNQMRADGASSNRTFTSDPLIGTVPNLIQYKGQSTVFNSYTNKVAPHAEKIKVSEAGFTAYTGSGSTQLSDSEVQSYGVAMLIIHCKNDAIHTYWEPNGSPGDPEPRLPGKTGQCNIVKGYYKENLTTGAKESLGVYYEKEVTSNIIVSGEPDFELVEWRVTDTTSTGVDPINWNPPGSPTQQGKSGSTLKLVDPEECVYVLLKQV